MFEKEVEEYVMREDVITENDRVPFDNGYGFQTVSFEDEVKKSFKDGAEFGYNKAKKDADEMKSRFLELCNLKDMRIKELEKANEWHYPSKGELPNVNQACYFIHSNTYREGKPIFTKSSIQVHAGIYTYILDEEGNETTDFCFYDDFIEEDMDINEVYAWKEIVLPELPKEN